MLDNFEKDLLARSEKLLAQPQNIGDIGKHGSSKLMPQNYFRPGGVQAANGLPIGNPAASILCPARSGIGKHRMAYRSVEEAFWQSPRVWGLSRDAKLVYIYLISMGGLTGIVRVLPETIGTILDPQTTHNAGMGEYWEPDWATHAAEELERAGRIGWQREAALFWVKGQIEHQILGKGELDQNKAKFLKKEIEKLPEGIIRQGITEKYWEIIKGAIQGQSISDSPPIASTKPLRSPIPSPPQPPGESKVKESKVFKSMVMVGKQRRPPQFQQTVNHIHQSWEAKFNAKPNWNGKDGANLKTLLGRNPPDLIIRAWDYYLANPDFYASQNGQSFQNFCAVFDKTVSRLSKTETPKNDLPEGKNFATFEEMSGG